VEFPGDGSTLYERLEQLPELQRVFQKSLETTTSSNVEQLIANVDFGSIRHVVDIGGGNGTALCALASRYSQLRATLVDKQSVCDLARERIARDGLSERLRVYPCDCFADPLPEGADCFLFMHFLTIWSESQNVRLLRRAFESLPSGGTVVVFDGAQSNDRCGPLRAARWSPYFLALSSGQGMFYSLDEYSSWIQQAGFIVLEQVFTAPDHALITGRKP
jgi:SAM-dependent methyltransferase